MPITQALEFRGGSHDGVRHEPSTGGCPLPDTLWRISWNDGERFARTDEEFVDEDGQRRVVFRHDPDGALSQRAKRAFSGLPEPAADS